MQTDTTDTGTMIPVATSRLCSGTAQKSRRQSDDAKRIAGLVGVLAEAFRQKISPATIEAYRIGLAELDPADIERAVHTAIRTCKFMPVPAELRELAGEAKPEDRAVLAFAVVERVVVRYGGYRSPHFDDPIINATIRNLGGWERVCEMPTAEFQRFFRQDFLKTYSAFCRTGVNGDLTAPLVGYFERENAKLGYHRPQDVVTVRTGLPWIAESAGRLRGDDLGQPARAKLLVLRHA